MRFGAAAGLGLYGKFYSHAVAVHDQLATGDRRLSSCNPQRRSRPSAKSTVNQGEPVRETTLEAREGLRERGDGVHQDPADGLWTILRFADVSSAMRDHARFSSEGLSNSEGDRIAEVSTPRNVLFSDPPTHTHLRALISRAFTPRATRQLRPHIDFVANELFSRIIDPEMDLVAQLAAPLPVTVIADLLAIPDQDRSSFSRWSDAATVLVSPVASDDAKAAARPLVSEFNRYVRTLVAERRNEAGDDVLSNMVQAEADDNQLTDREAADMALLLIAAGNETTTALIANGVDALLAHPDQLDRLRSDHALVDSAIEEVLRFAPPVIMVFRRAVQDVQIGETVVPRGAYVALDIEVANRDPREFNDPDSFDVGRDPNRHLTFGGGPHFCLGAPLARLEAEVAILQLLERYPALAAGSSKPVRLPFSHASGFSSYPVRLQAGDVVQPR